MARFGQQKPIVIRPDGTVIAGNGFLAAAHALGWLDVWVVETNLEGEEAMAFALADNRTAELAEWDLEILAASFARLQAAGVPVSGLGWTDEDASRIADAVRRSIEKRDAEVEDVPENPVSKTGEVYDLGPHRLACGDCRNQDLFSDLMGTSFGAMLWTDPPYGVAYVGKTAEALTIDNDKPEDLQALLRDAFFACDSYLEPGAGIYIAHPAGRLSLVFCEAMIASGWHWHQTLVWVKNSMVLGHSDHHYKHEPILYGWKGKDRRWFGGRDKVSVFEVDRPSRSTEHPTMKPVDLIEPMIVNSTAAGEIVIDPFGGSGSTLIAANNAGRIARLVELDPGYCDVVRKRWGDYARSNGFDPGADAL